MVANITLPPLPRGRDVARILRLFAHRQLHEILAHVQRGHRCISLYHYVAPMTDALFPHVLHLFQRGAQSTMQGIAATVAGRRGAKAFTDFRRCRYVVKAAGSERPLFRRVLDLFGSAVIDRARQATQAFVQGVLATVADKVNRILGNSTSPAAAAPEIAAVILDAGHQRAAASDLAVRTTHDGARHAAKESGVVQRMMWEIEDNAACEVCRLLDGEVRELDEPFYIWPGGGEFARVMCPPAHPHCRCRLLPIVQDDALLAA